MTIHPADGSTRVTARRSLARWNLELERGRLLIRYGFSVVCVAVALGLALAGRRYGFGDAELPLFDLAIVVVTWFAGIGPSAIAVALSTASFDYFLSSRFIASKFLDKNYPTFLFSSPLPRSPPG